MLLLLLLLLFGIIGVSFFIRIFTPFTLFLFFFYFFGTICKFILFSFLFLDNIISDILVHENPSPQLAPSCQTGAVHCAIFSASIGLGNSGAGERILG